MLTHHLQTLFSQPNGYCGMVFLGGALRVGAVAVLLPERNSLVISASIGYFQFLLGFFGIHAVGPAMSAWLSKRFFAALKEVAFPKADRANSKFRTRTNSRTSVVAFGRKDHVTFCSLLWCIGRPPKPTVRSVPRSCIRAPVFTLHVSGRNWEG